MRDVVENAVWAAVVAELGLEGVNVPRRRNMAEGFSLESLYINIAVKAADKVKHTYIPNSWKPFPGQKKCTAAPYPSGKGTR